DVQQRRQQRRWRTSASQSIRRRRRRPCVCLRRSRAAHSGISMSITRSYPTRVTDGQPSRVNLRALPPPRLRYGVTGRLGASAVFFILALILAARIADAQAPSTVAADAQYQEARRLFDALDYEKAVGALDQAIPLLQAITPRDMPTRDKLANAYE